MSLLCSDSCHNPHFTQESLQTATTQPHQPHQQLLLSPPQSPLQPPGCLTAPGTPRNTPTSTSLHQLLSIWNILPPENSSVRPVPIAKLDHAPCHLLAVPGSSLAWEIFSFDAGSSPSGMEPGSPALGVWSLSHWVVPRSPYFYHF